MSLRIRRLKLMASTLNGQYGADLIFPDGLVLLHLHNTRGKSTALKSIIYCLGLERMFGNVSQAPLTPAMTSKLKDGDREWEVVESWAYLQIQNREGRHATLRRKVTGEGGQDRKVVDIWELGIDEVQGGHAPSVPHFALDPGSAQHERGVAAWLAQFIGWELPQVVHHDGSLGLLYIECMLSLFFVEQSQGWTTIQAGTPRHFGIRQVERKAFEFILGLEACYSDSTREHLEEQVSELVKKWAFERNSAEVLARSVKGSLRNLPPTPLASWPPIQEPYIEAFDEGSEISLSNAIQKDLDTMARLDSVDIPTADEAAKGISEQLEAAFAALSEAESIGSALEDQMTLERLNSEALESRMKVVAEDLVRNKDTRKLRDFGASGNLVLARNECPACHQPVNDTLLSQRLEQQVMGLDENIAYLEAQRQTLERMLDRTEGAKQAIKRKMEAVSTHASGLRRTIRSLRRSLVSSGLGPSEAAVREKVVVDERLQTRREALAEFDRILKAFPPLAAQWTELQVGLKSVRSRIRSSSDFVKLQDFAASFKEALIQFGFESFPIDAVSIDQDSYRPKRQGFDLAYAVSASDHVRIIAAYVSALFEVSRSEQTNHPGLLVLDEPRQQNMQWADFAKILSRLSSASSFGQQVIVATSDRPEAIQGLMKDIRHSRVALDYDEWLLKPISITNSNLKAESPGSGVA